MLHGGRNFAPLAEVFAMRRDHGKRDVAHGNFARELEFGGIAKSFGTFQAWRVSLDIVGSRLLKERTRLSGLRCNWTRKLHEPLSFSHFLSLSLSLALSFYLELAFSLLLTLGSSYFARFPRMLIAFSPNANSFLTSERRVYPPFFLPPFSSLRFLTYDTSSNEGIYPPTRGSRELTFVQGFAESRSASFLRSDISHAFRFLRLCQWTLSLDCSLRTLSMPSV